MKYSIISNPEKPTHKDANGNLFLISKIEDKTVCVGKSVTVATDISEYTPLQSYLSEQAVELERAKDRAVTRLNAQLEHTLKRGVVVGDITLHAQEKDMNSLTQGTVLLQAAESVTKSAVAFGDMNVSDLFGRGVTDIKGDQHDMTVSEYRQLIVEYGRQIGTLQGETLSKVKQVKDATTKEEIEVVVPKPKKEKGKEKAK